MPCSEDIDQRLRPTVSGHSLAVVCVLLYISPAATSLATSPPATVSVTLAWDASPTTNVAGYKIYYGTNSASYTQVVSAGPATQRTIAGLTPGTSYFLLRRRATTRAWRATTRTKCRSPRLRPGRK